MYKMIYGIPVVMSGFSGKLNERGHIEDLEIEDGIDPWCDFELDYYPDENYYKFEFETMLAFEKTTGARDWIVNCLSCLTVYMDKHKYDISKEFNMYEVFTEGVDVNCKFKTIEYAYAWLKMMVFGFHGKGLEE